MIQLIIQRQQFELIAGDLGKGKIVIIYGPRRIGKTTVAKQLLEQIPEEQRLYLNCDALDVQQALKPTSLERLEQVIAGAKRIVIDEAQRVENIGLTLKLLIDAHPELDIIATGSSSFDLANRIKEPLTGRAFEHMLMPLALSELVDHYKLNRLQIREQIAIRLRYGSYPSLVGLSDRDAERELDTIVENYLYKDTLELVELRQRQILPRLLQALALQLGSEVSYNELANLLGVNLATVERYITLLESAFVVYRLPALRGNDRSSLSSRKRKVYFYDLGVRNAIVNNFNPLELRQDVEALWENFVVNELKKMHAFAQDRTRSYYWRGLYGEVDLVEQTAGDWYAYECKWDSSKQPKIPQAFKDYYPDIDVHVLNPDTLLDFVGSRKSAK